MEIAADSSQIEAEEWTDEVATSGGDAFYSCARLCREGEIWLIPAEFGVYSGDRMHVPFFKGVSHESNPLDFICRGNFGHVRCR